MAKDPREAPRYTANEKTTPNTKRKTIIILNHSKQE